MAASTTDARTVSSVHLCPETNTVTVIGPLAAGALFMAQAMCAPNDVLVIVSILDRPENYVFGYVSKNEIGSFMTSQERLAIERRLILQMTVYDGPEMVIAGTFDGGRPISSAN